VAVPCNHEQAIDAAMLAGPRDMFVRRGDVYHRASLSSEDVEHILHAYQSALNTPPAADEVERLKAENEEAKREARILAQAMWEQSYADATEWQMLDDTAGIITQISNMAAGVRDRATNAEAEVQRLTARIAGLEGALEAAYRDGHSDGSRVNDWLDEALKTEHDWARSETRAALKEAKA
jgi:hypothetical protein